MHNILNIYLCICTHLGRQQTCVNISGSWRWAGGNAAAASAALPVIGTRNCAHGRQQRSRHDLLSLLCRREALQHERMRHVCDAMRSKATPVAGALQHDGSITRAERSQRLARTADAAPLSEMTSQLPLSLCLQSHPACAWPLFPSCFRASRLLHHLPHRPLCCSPAPRIIACVAKETFLTHVATFLAVA